MIQMKNAKLRKARRERGWTQRHLAERVGVEAITVRAWERGFRSPSLYHRSELCKMFVMTAAQLGLETDTKEEQKRPQLPSAGSQSEQECRQKMIETIMAEISRRLSKIVIDRFADFSYQEQLYTYTYPWEAITNLPPRPFSLDTCITDLCHESSGGLLVLGEPGSGKTTLLLILTHILLERAQRDANSSIPILVNLSSWAVKRIPLREWLIDEIHAAYHIPRELAQACISTHFILPLLDGLNEVAEIHRAELVQAINAYRNESRTTAIVIACRASEYMNLDIRIGLKEAVVICRNCYPRD